MYNLRGWSLIVLYTIFCISACNSVENDLKIEFNNVFNPGVNIEGKNIKKHLNLMSGVDLPLYADTIADTIYVFEVYETIASQSWVIRNFTVPNDSIDLWLSNYNCVSMTDVDSQNDFAIRNYKNNLMLSGNIVRGDSSLIVKYYFRN